MKISVVVPAYNEENFIARCLDSLENQEEKADEIIVVDNNSTDRTVPIAKRFKVKIIKEKKQGISYARNAGFNAAKGEIIARCDADCNVPQDWIKRIKKHFLKGKMDALGGPVCYSDVPFLKKHSTTAVKLHAKAFKKIKNHDLLYGMNMSLRKEMWEKVKNELNNNNKQVHEDMDLSNRIHKYGKIKFDPKLYVYTSSRRMRKNPASFFIEYPIRMIKTLRDDQGDNSLKQLYRAIFPKELE